MMISKVNIKPNLMFLAAIIIIAACDMPKEADQEVNALKLENMDTTVDPGDDFFRYVNGRWLDSTEIPAQYPLWGSFLELRDYNSDVLAAVVKSAAKNPSYPQGSDQWKVAKFYEIGMDSTLAERSGVSPLEPLLATINGVDAKAEVQKAVAELGIYGVTAFYGLYGSPDRKNSKLQVAYLGQGGLGMPDRDYYLKTDARSEEIKTKYKALVSQMLQFLGYEATDADKAAEQIYKIEYQLAQASLDRVERRKSENTYNKMAVAELGRQVPSVDWAQFFSDSGLEPVDTIIVNQPKFMAEVQKIIQSYPLEDIKSYLKWHLINGFSSYLNNAVVEASFNFYSREIRGTQEMEPRWKRVMTATDRSLGEALGKLYVDSVFPPEAKEKALAMVENIKTAFAERIKNLDWMSDTTKQEALKKLSTFTVKIGYPDEWRSYQDLELDSDLETASYAKNIMNARRFDHYFEVEKIGKPVDKSEWGMTPQTVNAYYNPVFNEIVFPAGILQPPFYNYKADEAVNYGGMGAVIGHEIGHGFDDQGSKYDADGNLKNWWTEGDRQRFDARTKMLADQYSGYQPLDSVFVNGAFTLGENIGDLGGLTMAYDGLQLYFEKNGRPGLIDGFTPEQRFFLSWASCWKLKYRDAYMRNMVLTDPHSPGQYRANGPLENMEVFYKAFNVEEGDRMWKPEESRVKIW